MVVADRSSEHDQPPRPPGRGGQPEAAATPTTAVGWVDLCGCPDTDGRPGSLVRKAHALGKLLTETKQK